MVEEREREKEREKGDGERRLVERTFSNHRVAKFINNETESEMENPDDARPCQRDGPGESGNAKQWE